jgi:DNA gyrase subunit A
VVDVPPTDTPQHDRVELVGIEVEMQRSFIDYAMSVIVSRALPDVRDGLKPVHRRVLYAMYDGGYRPDRGYVKCARVVGDVMGNYHPHGDTAIYDTLVRLAQPWSMRAPLIDGNGNFGSPGNDPAAAMRYCLAGDTCVRMADGTEVPIETLVPGIAPSSEVGVDLKVVGLHGDPVPVTKVFHSGSHPTLRVLTTRGDLVGTTNHPVLAWSGADWRWLLLDEVRPGDLLARASSDGGTPLDATSWLVRDDAARRLPTPLPATAFGTDEVVAVEDAGVQPVYSIRVDTDDHAFVSNGFVSHNTESKLAPLAMEMLREIDQETVDFVPNYDGRSQEPTVLPSRIPNLLVNGAAGIAVGMATNIPPHNLREVASGVEWALDHPDATSEELLEALLERIPGPDFPTAALIVGKQGIEEAYRTGRGSIRMRAVVEVDEDRKGRTILVVTELPYQVNPDNLAEKIADLVKEGKVSGIADVKDESSARTGQRLVIVLKRDAVAKVVLNNLYKHTPLQDTFGANMLAIVDGVPRTLRLDEFVSNYVAHQVTVIQRRTQYQLRKAEERAHILRGYGRALDQLDAVIALIRGSESADAARTGLMDLLGVDDIQARAILDLQLRRLAALERQALIDELAEKEREIADLKDILANEPRQRSIIKTELAEIVEKYGDDRRTRFVAAEGDLSDEDLIAQEDVVVTVTRGGYAKRTKTDVYRQQRRGGRGVQGAALREDDIVEHFFVTTTHHWILFFTNKGRVYRAKAHELPEQARTAKGQHVANILAFQPDEKIAQVIDIKDYDAAPYLVLATRKGITKKTALRDFDSNRSGGLIAVNLRDDDELIGAALISNTDDLILVSRQAQSIRFTADDEALRPMGRATSGVIGMRLNPGDELLSMQVVKEGAALLVVTDGGFGKKTRMEEYSPQGRGGKGVLTARLVAKRGKLVGALVVQPDDEIFAITSSGVVIRMSVKPLRHLSRATMGVKLINLDPGATVVAVALNAENEADDEEGATP